MVYDSIACREAQELQRQLVAWRRTLHQIPERGMDLPRTMAFIREKLDGMGISYKFYEEISCIVATIGSGEKCFLLRSDVDALPMAELADVPYKSTVENVCHSCGQALRIA